VEEFRLFFLPLWDFFPSSVCVFWSSSLKFIIDGTNPHVIPRLNPFLLTRDKTRVQGNTYTRMSVQWKIKSSNWGIYTAHVLLYSPPVKRVREHTNPSQRCLCFLF
jgi:hypothetical protein